MSERITAANLDEVIKRNEVIGQRRRQQTSGADGKNRNGNSLLPEKTEMVLECSAGRRCCE